MSKRKENIRRDCYEINRCIYHATEAIKDNNNHSAKMWLYNVKKLTHRIKRTTWRGDEKKFVKVSRSRQFNNDVSNMPYY